MYTTSILQDVLTSFASCHGLSVNAEKVSIVSVYLKTRDDDYDTRPNIAAVARQYNVS